MGYYNSLPQAVCSAFAILLPPPQSSGQESESPVFGLMKPRDTRGTHRVVQRKKYDNGDLTRLPFSPCSIQVHKLQIIFYIYN